MFGICSSTVNQPSLSGEICSSDCPRGLSNPPLTVKTGKFGICVEGQNLDFLLNALLIWRKFFYTYINANILKVGLV